MRLLLFIEGHMTVKELIATLEACNQDAPVYVRTGAGKFLLIDEDVFHLEEPNRVEIAIEFRENK
jgi:hypothetical protein